MLVFAARYLSLRNDYVIPLINYKITAKSLEYNNIKTVLTKFKSVSNVAANSCSLVFDEDQLLKALIGDIEYFLTRTIVQYKNLQTSTGVLDPSWNIVTQYYFSFFSATTCLRLLNRGNTFLNNEQSDLLSKVATVMTGNLVKFNPGNYTFQIKESSDPSELILELALTKQGSHEQLWITTNDFITDLTNQQGRDDEYTILSIIRNMTKTYGTMFPSTLRNQINYQPRYGLDSIDNELMFSAIIESDLKTLVDKILSFQFIKSENGVIQASSIYGYFLFVLMYKLYLELVERGHVCKEIHKKREAYMKRHNVKLPEYPNYI